MDGGVASCAVADVAESKTAAWSAAAVVGWYGVVVLLGGWVLLLCSRARSAEELVAVDAWSRWWRWCWVGGDGSDWCGGWGDGGVDVFGWM